MEQAEEPRGGAQPAPGLGGSGRAWDAGERVTWPCGRTHGRSSECTGAVPGQQVTLSEWNVDNDTQIKMSFPLKSSRPFSQGVGRPRPPVLWLCTVASVSFQTRGNL